MRKPIGEHKPWLARVIILLVLIALAYAIGVWRQHWQQLKQIQQNHEEQVTTDSESATSDNGTAAENTATATAENPTETVSKDTSNLVLKEVKRTTTRVEETAAVQLTNAFEMAFNQRSAANLLPLFADQNSVTNQIVQISEANSYRPIAFSFESIEVRGDSSILVTVTENRADNENNRLTVRRLLELIPQNGVYQIGNYFTPDSTVSGSGFAKD